MARRGGQAVGMPPKVMAKKTMRRDIAIIVFLVLATVGAYLPAARCQFVYFDDRGYVFENRDVLAGLAWPGPAWAFTTTWGSNWHPVTWLSHMLDCQLFGPSAGAHHLVSVALHAASAVLLFWLLRRMTASVWPSAMVAALFALHPLHVESVAWVSERKDVLSTFFGLLALLAYVRYAAWPCVVRYLPVFALMAVGLMAKPMLVTLPFVMLLLDWWPLRRFGYSAGGAFLVGAPPCGCPVVLVGHDGRPRGAAPTARCSSGTIGRLVLEKLPLFTLVAASCIITYIAQQRGGAMEYAERLTFLTRLTNAPVVYVAYLGKAVWPAALAVFYPYVAPPVWQAVLAMIFLAAVTALVLWQRRRRPYLAVGWFWYLGMLVPVIGLVQVGKQAMADRYTYLPLVGIFLAVVWAAADVLSGWRHRAKAFAAAAAAVLVACGILTIRQVQEWTDTETLFRHAIAVTGDNAVAHSAFGELLYARGRYAEAASSFAESVRLAPDYAEAQYNLGLSLTQAGRLQEAVGPYREAIRLDPRDPQAFSGLGTVLMRLGRAEEAAACFREALLRSPQVAGYRRDLAASLLAQQQYDLAAAESREALRIDPNDVVARNNLAAALAQLGQTDEALSQFHETTRRHPGYAPARLNYAQLLLQAGRWEEADRQLRAALLFEPNMTRALALRAGILAAAPQAALRNGAEAVALAERACTLTDRRDSGCLDALAAAYAEVGRFPEAVATAREAVALARQQQNHRLAGVIDGHLKLYEAGQPLREQP
jgi:Flp pilus assembly protein TadD